MVQQISFRLHRSTDRSTDSHQVSRPTCRYTDTQHLLQQNSKKSSLMIFKSNQRKILQASTSNQKSFPIRWPRLLWGSNPIGGDTKCNHLTCNKRKRVWCYRAIGEGKGFYDLHLLELKTRRLSLMVPTSWRSTMPLHVLRLNKEYPSYEFLLQGRSLTWMSIFFKIVKTN